jgi:flavorubredoxin
MDDHSNASKEQALRHEIAAFEQLLVRDLSKKVLIAYGSRYGSTDEIARAMVQIKVGGQSGRMCSSGGEQKWWKASCRELKKCQAI